MRLKRYSASSDKRLQQSTDIQVFVETQHAGDRPARSEETDMFSHSGPILKLSAFSGRRRRELCILSQMDAHVIRDVGLVPGIHTSRNPDGDAHLRLSLGC